jgi:hypothetical protein
MEFEISIFLFPLTWAFGRTEILGVILFCFFPNTYAVLLMQFILLVRRNSGTGFFFASHRYKLHRVAAESLGLCNGTYVRLYRIVAAEVVEEGWLMFQLV